jgi:hypothetical protein
MFPFTPFLHLYKPAISNMQSQRVFNNQSIVVQCTSTLYGGHTVRVPLFKKKMIYLLFSLREKNEKKYAVNFFSCCSPFFLFLTCNQACKILCRPIKEISLCKITILMQPSFHQRPSTDTMLILSQPKTRLIFRIKSLY